MKGKVTRWVSVNPNFWRERKVEAGNQTYIIQLLALPLGQTGSSDKQVVIDWLIDGHLYSAILRSLEQTHCARLWFYMSDKLFIARFLNIHRSGVLTELAWLVPHETAAVSAQVLCTPYNHVTSCKATYACLAVTCHLHFCQNDRDLLRASAVTLGWNGYRNKSTESQPRIRKKILPHLQDLNLRPFSHKSGALTTELFPLFCLHFIHCKNVKALISNKKQLEWQAHLSQYSKVNRKTSIWIGHRHSDIKDDSLLFCNLNVHDIYL